MRNFIFLLLITYPLFSGDPQFSTELKEIPIFQNYEGFIHAFGDIDGDGDDDLITNEFQSHYFPDTSRFSLYRNTGNSYNPVFQPIDDVFNILNQRSFTAIRIQDVNADDLPDITAIYKDSLNYVFSYLNTGTLSDPVYGETIDTLFTTTLDTFEVVDYLLYNLIEDSEPEIIIGLSDNSHFEPHSKLELYKRVAEDSLVKVPGYFPNLSAQLNYNTGITSICFIHDSALSFPYLLINFYTTVLSDETNIFASKILRNAGSPEIPNWVQVDIFDDAVIHYIADEDTGFFSFSYQLNGRGAIESELWYNNINISENDIELRYPRLLKNNGSINDIDVFDWKNDGTEDLVLLINRHHNNGNNFPGYYISFNQCIASFVFEDSIRNYFPAQQFNNYWFDNPLNGSETHSFFDYENDGDTDIFIKQWDRLWGNYLVINEESNHHPDWSLRHEIYDFNITRPELADIDNDNDMDLIGIDFSLKKMMIYLNKGNENHFDLDSIPIVLFSTSDRYSYVTTADFDGDGDLDIVTDKRYFRNESNGGDFNFIEVSTVPHIDTSYPVLAFDGDRDGDYDLIYSARGERKLYFIENVMPLSIAIKPKTIANHLHLSSNYPNPFNGATQIEFYLPNTRTINVSIYNILGEKIDELYNGKLSTGEHRLSWNARNHLGEEMASGLYFVRLFSPEEDSMMKILLIK